MSERCEEMTELDCLAGNGYICDQCEWRVCEDCLGFYHKSKKGVVTQFCQACLDEGMAEGMAYCEGCKQHFFEEDGTSTNLNGFWCDDCKQDAEDEAEHYRQTNDFWKNGRDLKR